LLGNVRDHRTDPTNPHVDAAFEPSIHDDGRRADGVHHFRYDEAANSPDYFIVKDLLDTTVRVALWYAETRWPFPVTVFLYDQGTRPLDWAA
jgi:hypothetical protein